MTKQIALLIACALTNGCGTLLHHSHVVPKVPAEEIASLPAGAYIGVCRELSPETRQLINGTVLQSGPEGIVLMNCNCMTQRTTITPGLSRVPYIKRYFTSTGVGKELVPVLWIPSAEIESTMIVEPASGNETPPQLNIDLSHGFVAERRGIDYDFSIEDVKNSPTP